MNKYHGKGAGLVAQDTDPAALKSQLGDDMAKREYKRSDDALTVFWNSDLCHHCGNCFIKLEQVFQPDQRPWIKIDAATSDKIAEVVRQCPSGAIALEPN